MSGCSDLLRNAIRKSALKQDMADQERPKCCTRLLFNVVFQTKIGHRRIKAWASKKRAKASGGAKQSEKPRSARVCAPAPGGGAAHRQLDTDDTERVCDRNRSKLWARSGSFFLRTFELPQVMGAGQSRLRSWAIGDW